MRSIFDRKNNLSRNHVLSGCIGSNGASRIANHKYVKGVYVCVYWTCAGVSPTDAVHCGINSMRSRRHAQCSDNNCQFTVGRHTLCDNVSSGSSRSNYTLCFIFRMGSVRYPNYPICDDASGRLVPGHNAAPDMPAFPCGKSAIRPYQSLPLN